MDYFWFIIDEDGNTLQTVTESFKPRIGESIILGGVSWRIVDIKYGIYTYGRTHADRVFLMVKKDGEVRLIDHQHLLV